MHHMVSLVADPIHGVVVSDSFCAMLTQGFRAALERAPDGIAKLQKQAFSAYKCRHWIIVRAERAGATRTHARSALAGGKVR